MGGKGGVEVERGGEEVFEEVPPVCDFGDLDAPLLSQELVVLNRRCCEDYSQRCDNLHQAWLIHTIIMKRLPHDIAILRSDLAIPLHTTLQPRQPDLQLRNVESLQILKPQEVKLLLILERALYILGEILFISIRSH